jgi:hypothetical protein
MKLLIKHDIIKIVINEKIYFFKPDEHLTIFDACLKRKAKNILEFIINNHPEILGSFRSPKLPGDLATREILGSFRSPKLPGDLATREIIPQDIDYSLIERQDIQKYNFIKMLINRNLTDIPD